MTLLLIVASETHERETLLRLSSRVISLVTRLTSGSESGHPRPMSGPRHWEAGVTGNSAIK